MFEAHFQTFTDLSEPAHSATRLAALRAELRRQGLDGFVVPHSDRQMNEYLPACEERLAWLTGFTGSAGRAIVLQDRAALFVDGRYTLQATTQTDPTVTEIVPIAEVTPPAWIGQTVSTGTRLGYDPWLHTPSDIESLAAACKAVGAELVACEKNPLDTIWSGRPAAPLAPVVLHDLRYAGEDATAKLDRIRQELVAAKVDALVISSALNVAWTFNIRGADVTHTPLALAFAIIPRAGRPSLFVDGRKLSNAVREALESVASVQEPTQLETALRELGRDRKTVRLDQTTGVEALRRLIADAGGTVNAGADPVTAMKAVKNATEIEGSRAAHLRDGVAVARFLAWFDREAPSGRLTEIECVKALESFRRETGVLKDVSFPTISGSGPNGAIVHYRVTEATDRRLAAGELYLVDSGAQYLDGTTDITRTLAIGEPTAEMRDRFTRVLQGHIGIARAVFPEGTGGGQLDMLARRHLWSAGLDYGHGTGHGVGAYLSVHEGPISIHKSNMTPLRRGMIVSNEPGYYKTAAFGIRIENLVLVVEGPKPAGGELPLNAFQTLTLAPIDRGLIDPTLLSADERDWVEAYHARVRAELSPHLDAATREWLAAATLPLT